MGAPELKEKIKEHLTNADETVLSIVNGVFENYYNEKIVAYFPDGSPMSLAQYLEANERSKKQIESGDYIPVEELEKMNL